MHSQNIIDKVKQGKGKQNRYCTREKLGRMPLACVVVGQLAQVEDRMVKFVKVVKSSRS